MQNNTQFNAQFVGYAWFSGQTGFVISDVIKTVTAKVKIPWHVMLCSPTASTDVSEQLTASVFMLSHHDA
jgi:hypothetical protein